MPVIHFENCESEKEKARLCAMFLSQYFEVNPKDLANTFTYTNKGEVKQQVAPF